MTDTTETEQRITVRPSMALAQRTRPRGMWGQITTSLLRPGLFYRTLHPASETRQWLWAQSDLTTRLTKFVAAMRVRAGSDDESR